MIGITQQERVLIILAATQGATGREAAAAQKAVYAHMLRRSPMSATIRGAFRTGWAIDRLNTQHPTRN